MKVLSLAGILVAALVGQPPIRGVWAGTFQTPHGAAPLELTIPPSESPVSYRMTVFGRDWDGAVRNWRVAGDSLHFAVGFVTNMGEVEFHFDGGGPLP